LDTCCLIFSLGGGGGVKNALACGTKDLRRGEAFFAGFAESIRDQVLGMHLMLTGGFKSSQGMIQALDRNWADVVGIGKGFCIDPLLPVHVLDSVGKQEKWDMPGVDLKFNFTSSMFPSSDNSAAHLIDSVINVSFYRSCMYKLARRDPEMMQPIGYRLVPVLWDVWWTYLPRPWLLQAGNSKGPSGWSVFSVFVGIVIGLVAVLY